MQKYAILTRFDVENADETARVGCMVRERALHLLGVTRDGRGIVGDNPLEYGNARSMRVQKPGTAAALLAEVRAYAAQQGLDLVGWDSDAKVATFAVLTPTVREIRGAWARTLKVQPHEVDVFAEYSKDEPRFERIVARVPSTSITADRRVSNLQELAAAIPGFTSGWSIEENTLTGRVDFTYGVKAELPRLVPLADILPDCLSPEDWAFSAFGKDAFGRISGHDLSRGPHTLLFGPTNSGKTVAINAMLVSRLVRGHDLLIIDPTKALDFPWAEEFALAIATTYAEAHAAIDWVTAEHERRKAIMQKHRVPNWKKLAPEVRAAEGIKPLTVLADELTTLLQPVKVNQALPKGSPERAAMEAESLAVATIDEGLRKVTAVMRASGIFAILATQKAKGENMGVNGTTLRSNSQNAVYIHPVGTNAEKAAVSLLFDSRTDDAVALAEAMGGPNSPLHPGVAVTMAESGDLAALRVAYAEPEDIPALLHARGVPTVTPLNLGAQQAPAPSPAAPAAAPAEPVIPADWR